MSDKNAFEVVWPGGRSRSAGVKLARRLDSLEGKVIALLWDEIFKGDIMFEGIGETLKQRYPGIRFVGWREFGQFHGEAEKKTLAELPGKLRQLGADAVICGVGC